MNRLILIFLLALIPSQALGIGDNDRGAVIRDTIFYDNTDYASGQCSVTTGGGGDTLDGHTLPASTGGTGQEEAIDAQGRVASTGGRVAFWQNANLGQAYRDYYITMRWRYAKWAWNGTTQSGPESVDFYSKAPRVLVTNPRTKKSIIAVVMEAGPAPWTGVSRTGSDNPPSYWQGYVDGTPTQYKGRVSGFPPKAIQALGAKMRMWDGSGDDLIYTWAPDQKATPGPTTVLAQSGEISDSCNGGGLGVDPNGLTFPLITTQAALRRNSPRWCFSNQSNCHHDYNAADIFQPEGTPVVAAVGGKVLKAVDVPSCSASSIASVRVHIKGEDGVYYYYNHMSPGSLKIADGQSVKAGDQIGAIGAAACAQGTPPHVHFQASNVQVNNTTDVNERKQYLNVQPALINAFGHLPEK